MLNGSSILHIIATVRASTGHQQNFAVGQSFATFRSDLCAVHIGQAYIYVSEVNSNAAGRTAE